MYQSTNPSFSCLTIKDNFNNTGCIKSLASDFHQKHTKLKLII